LSSLNRRTFRRLWACNRSHMPLKKGRHFIDSGQNLSRSNRLFLSLGFTTFFEFLP
jgi:hypothetical protein